MKKQLMVLLGLLCAIFFLVSAVKAEDLAGKQKELANVRQKLEEKQRELRIAKQKEQSALQRLFIVRHELHKTRSDLNQARGQLYQNEQRVSQLSVALEEAKKRLDSQAERLTKRLAETYKSGGINYLTLLFASSSMGDFINRSYYFEKLLGRDVNLVKDIRQQRQDISSKKQEMEVATGQIRSLTQVIQTKADQVGQQVREEGVVYDGLKVRRQEYEREVRELKATSQEIENWIQTTTRGINPNKIKTKGSGQFIWPLHGPITSPFGYRRSPFWGGSDFHTGLDIAGPYGSPIIAADSGEVIFSGWWDGYGKAVIINHGRGFTTLYGHMSRIYVRKGSSILKGQTVGLVGTTGYSTGPHLHFEVRVNGKPTNPMRWL